MFQVPTLLAVVDFFSASLKLGLIISIMVIGVHISYRILNCADLGIEGIFPLGGCICALLIFYNVSPVIGTIAALVIGAVGGLITALLYTKLKIPMILSGIITLTGFYSINLAILGITQKNSLTRASLSIDPSRNIFHAFVNIFNKLDMKQSYSVTLSTIIISALILMFVVFAIYYFFGTEIGMSIRATGDNEQMARAQGINTDKSIIIGLVISNALIGLSGGLFAQNLGNVSVNNGKGMIVIGLAAIIIGEAIFGRKSYKSQLISLIIGTIIYYIMRQIAISLNLIAFLDLASAILIVIILTIPFIKEKVKYKKVKLVTKGENDA